ncbi:hypothetical protein Hanom_Chr01g00016621 [Helianthus anomalus]
MEPGVSLEATSLFFRGRGKVVYILLSSDSIIALLLVGFTDDDDALWCTPQLGNSIEQSHDQNEKKGKSRIYTRNSNGLGIANFIPMPGCKILSHTQSIIRQVFVVEYRAYPWVSGIPVSDLKNIPRDFHICI